jgi:hypothetical protein
VGQEVLSGALLDAGVVRTPKPYETRDPGVMESLHGIVDGDVGLGGDEDAGVGLAT